MAKTITVTLEDDELKLLDTMYKTIDFYGNGYDDRKKPGERKSGDIFKGLIAKLTACGNVMKDKLLARLKAMIEYSISSSRNNCDLKLFEETTSQPGVRPRETALEAIARNMEEVLKEQCDPVDACKTHGRCWTHSEWEDGTPTRDMKWYFVAYDSNGDGFKSVHNDIYTFARGKEELECSIDYIVAEHGIDRKDICVFELIDY